MCAHANNINKLVYSSNMYSEHKVVLFLGECERILFFFLYAGFQNGYWQVAAMQ